ncbi:MAG: argininosuccinate lyase [Lentisphaeraceae bacterium]|nr:argininosuccinate lyase [Lentisphaeraceae bacterium]
MSKPADTATTVGKINPDVLAFTEGKDPVLDLALAEVDCLGTAAHVTMLTRMAFQPTLFTPEQRNAVVAALADIIDEARRGDFTITAADQDVHLAVERRLTERLGDLGKKVHTCRSRNDQVAVDIRLHIRNELNALRTELADLAADLLALAQKHPRVPLVGRTHLQPAMPSSVAMWASGYAEMLLDDDYLLQAAAKVNNLCPLGSAAGYGVPLPIDRQLTSDLLAFDRPHHNVFYASCARGKDEAVLLSACSQVMLSLSRLAEDLILFSMPEFRYFTLPRDLCTGSSIMPQKYNPDVLELIRAKAALLVGQATAAATILKAMPGGYNRDLQDTKELYMEGLRTTRTSLRIMRLMAQNLTVNPDACRAAFAEPGVFATDRALELVASGMPFRDAYHQVRDHLEDLRGMDPDAVIAQKTHLGGTNGLDLAFLRARADALRAEATQAQAKVNAAFAALLQPIA